LRDVVVISRDAALSVALGASDHNVTSIRPDRRLNWPRWATHAEIAVLDLEDIDWTLEWVRALRRAKVDTPFVVIVKSAEERARLVDCAELGITPLTLPLSRDAVLAAVDAAAKSPLPPTEPVQRPFPSSARSRITNALREVVVVSGDPVLSVALSGSDHNVASIHPGRHRDWHQRVAHADIAVLDLENLDSTIECVRALRRADIDTPLVVIVKNQQERARLVDCAEPGITPLTPPLSRDAVLAAVDAAAKCLPPPPAAQDTSPTPVVSTPTGRASDPERVTELLAQLSIPSPKNKPVEKVRRRNSFDRKRPETPKTRDREGTPAATEPAPSTTAPAALRPQPVDRKPTATRPTGSNRQTPAKPGDRKPVDDSLAGVDRATAAKPESAGAAPSPSPVPEPQPASEASATAGQPQHARPAPRPRRRPVTAIPTTRKTARPPGESSAPRAKPPPTKAASRTSPARADQPTRSESPHESQPRVPDASTDPEIVSNRATAHELPSSPGEPTLQQRVPQPTPEERQPAAEGAASDVVTGPTSPMPEQREAPWARFFRRADRTKVESPPEDDSAEATPAIELVRKLSGVTRRLESPAQVGERIATLAQQVLSAAAAAVLVPDEGEWSVAAGVNVRPVQTRLRLKADHWVIREVLRAGNGLVIEDTDLARGRLAGVPLSQWQHLLALPVPTAGSLVIVTRADRSFDSKDLSRLSRALAGETARLKQALETRDLARDLERFTDED
jgi:hypothetical protein